MKLCNRIIEYSFYSLFLLVPLIFYGSTSELFELNKMWLTFGVTAIIMTAWISKMILQKQITIQRTLLDIPILLFLLSQILSTLLSLDPHVSWWGYYSRFNGGLLSTICYVLLYYAFVSNLNLQHVLKTIKISLLAGLLVALWGLPSHFGYDPTCLVFRGSLDVSCWTEAFKPTIRAFSTLGQPAWFAAYVAVLLPVAMAFALNKTKNGTAKVGLYMALSVLLYLSLTFANTRAGFIAFVISDVLFWGVLFLKKLFPQKSLIKSFLLIHVLFLLMNFLFGFPIEQLNKASLPGLMQQTQTQPAQETQLTQTNAATQEATVPTGVNITDSGKIRLFVWQGALDAWKSNALFGTGVETFAFAYYQYKPQGHNLTSEWDFLYNKAHNEYLNYLATTGLFGLGTYLVLIGFFAFQTGKLLMKKSKERTEKAHQLLVIGLVAGYLSILVSNFFGFSVVIINLYFFLIPAFVLIIADKLDAQKLLSFPSTSATNSSINPYQWTGIGIMLIVCCFILVDLLRYWYADINYALGANLNRVGQYQEAYTPLVTAVQTKPNEPVYTDELAINLAVLSTAFFAQQDAENAEQFANQAIALSNDITTKHPNNIVYWKNRVRLFYTLAQVDEKQQQTYYQEALTAIEKAHQLSPNDAKVAYNLGVLYGQTGNAEKGISILQETIKLKPDYRDAYFALGLFYHELGENEKAIETYEYILKNISPNDEEITKTLDEWNGRTK